MIKAKDRMLHLTLIASALFFGMFLPAQHAYSADNHSTNSPVIGDFRLSISTTNEFFVKGQPIVLACSFENISTNKAMFSAGFQPFRVTILDGNGKLVPETELGKQYLEPSGGSYSGFSIQAGSSFSCDLKLSAYFSLTNAGDYYVTVQHGQGGETWLAGPLRIGIVEQ